MSERDLTEVRKAKDMARVFLMNLGLSVIPFWCNTWFDQDPCDGGIFRNTFSSDPISPTQPQAAYYVMRTLCTVMDGANATELEVEFSSKSREFDNYNFALAENGMLVGVWLPGQSLDTHPGIKTDVIIRGTKTGRVVGTDTLNGLEQELEFKQEGDDTIVPELVVRDYPLVLRLSGVERKAHTA